MRERRKSLSQHNVFCLEDFLRSIAFENLLLPTRPSRSIVNRDIRLPRNRVHSLQISPSIVLRTFQQDYPLSASSIAHRI